MALAATAGHESALVSSGMVQQFEDLSEEVLYWASKQIDQDLAPGTSFGSAATALQRWGQPPEAAWPYDPQRVDTNPSYAPPPGALDPAVCRKAELLQIELTIEEVRGHLSSGRPVVLGVYLSLGFFSAPTGHIPFPSARDMIPEGHAVLVVGYNHSVPPGGVLILRNSWGPAWGDAGYGYLPYAYVQQYGGEAYTIRASPPLI